VLKIFKKSWINWYKRRPHISHDDSKAREKVDLTENAEYDAAKDGTGSSRIKIAQLQKQLANVKIYRWDWVDKSQVDFNDSYY
jgi:transcription elongation factor GreA